MCDPYNSEADTVVPVNDELFYAYGPRIDRADSMDYQELIEIPRPKEEPDFWVVNEIRVTKYTYGDQVFKSYISNWLANCDSKETAERLAKAFISSHVDSLILKDAMKYQYIASIENVWATLGNAHPNDFPAEDQGCENLAESIEAGILARALKST